MFFLPQKVGSYIMLWFLLSLTQKKWLFPKGWFLHWGPDLGSGLPAYTCCAAFFTLDWLTSVRQAHASYNALTLTTDLNRRYEVKTDRFRLSIAISDLSILVLLYQSNQFSQVPNTWRFVFWKTTFHAWPITNMTAPMMTTREMMTRVTTLFLGVDWFGHSMALFRSHQFTCLVWETRALFGIWNRGG